MTENPNIELDEQYIEYECFDGVTVFSEESEFINDRKAPKNIYTFDFDCENSKFIIHQTPENRSNRNFVEKSVIIVPLLRLFFFVLRIALSVVLLPYFIVDGFLAALDILPRRKTQDIEGIWKNIYVQIKINVSSFITIGLVYLITAIEATGDVTANSMISGLPIEGDSYLKRVSGGVMADGFNSFLAGVFNSFPNSIFAQNNGIIQLTGVASRYVGYYIAAMLVLLGLFPIVGAVFSLMPDPVLGGATLLMFGTVAAAGIRIISSQEIGRKETLVLAVSLSLGLGVELMPDVLKQAPEAIRSIFSSGITTGGLTAIVANMVIRVK